MKICKTCGRAIDEDSGELAYVVNPDLPTEYVECETCHDSSCNNGRVIMCEACGNYYSSDVLKDENVCGHSFTACPSCGRDVVDGLTRVEFEDEYFVPKYAAVVSFGSMTRGYQIAARGITEAMEKLIKHLGESGMNGFTAVYISEILLDGDIIS